MSVKAARLGPAVWCAAVLLLACAVEPALAQAKNPFSVGISEGGGSATGFTGWILAQQGWLEHRLSSAVRASRSDNAGLWTLIGFSLVYGVLHAAGPGHGKAVLASYMVANERALQRGIVLSFLAALLQGAVAVALVGVLALALHATAQRMKDAASFVETLSFAGIACLGLWLVWRKGTAFLRLWRLAPMRTVAARAAVLHEGGGGMSLPGPVQRLAFNGPAPAAASGRFVCVAGDAAHPADCAHCHAVDPAVLGGRRLSIRVALVTVVAAGSRPCSGAILVLVFALAQGLFLTGVAAVLAMSLGVAVTTAALASVAVVAKGLARRLATPGSRRGVLLLAGLEVLAALAVLLAGTALLLGDTLAAGA